MSEKERASVDKILENFDKMSDFQKGFVVGYAERTADDHMLAEKEPPKENSE